MTRGEAKQKKKFDAVVTKGTFQRQLGEMKKKIKTTITVRDCDSDVMTECLLFVCVDAGRGKMR